MSTAFVAAPLRVGGARLDRAARELFFWELSSFLPTRLPEKYGPLLPHEFLGITASSQRKQSPRNPAGFTLGYSVYNAYMIGVCPRGVLVRRGWRAPIFVGEARLRWACVLLVVMLLGLMAVITIAPDHALGASSTLGTTGSNPMAITIDSAGNIYTANDGSDTVTKILPDGTSTTAWATTGSKPHGITIDSAGNIYTVNHVSNTVTKITPEGDSSTLGTTGSNPHAITIDSAGNIYTANMGSNTVTKITPDGTSTTPWATTGSFPHAITIDSAGNIYTANRNSNTVTKITPDGTSTTSWATTGSSTGPRGITIDSAGNIYTANFGSDTVTKITPEGDSSTLGTTGKGPTAITIDSAGNIYTANQDSGTVTKITPEGDSSTLGTTGSSPRAITIDSAGNIYTANFGPDNVTKITQVPDAPTSVDASSGNGQVVVSWLAPVSNGGAAITAYTVTASPGSQTCEWSSEALSCPVTDLTNGTSYTFTVTATNSYGTSSASSASAAVMPATVPGVPTSVAGVSGNGQVVVSWSAPVGNGGAAITAYTVTASPGGQTCSWSSGALSCIVTGLTNGASYTFTVTATNAAGTSSASLASSAVTPATVPDAPTSVSDSSGNGQVVVSWLAPVGNGGAAITAYTATASPGGRTCGLSSGALSCTITGLINGASYTFTVTATNAAGTSSASLASSAVTPATVPDAPTSVDASSGNGQVVVSWLAPVGNGGAAITAYTATASPGGRTCGWLSGALSCTVTGLTNGTNYTFTVTATNAVGTSSPSLASSAVTPVAVPDAPTSVDASSGNGQVVVSWLAPVAIGGAAITAYTATASPGGRTCGWLSGALSCTVTGLTNGTNYTFTVTATNAVGTSSPSLADDATPRPPALTVRTFQARLIKTRVLLTSWATVSYAGKITQTITTGSGKKKKTWSTVTKIAWAAGSYKLTCNLGVEGRNYLSHNALKLTVTTTLRPANGMAATRSIKVVTLRKNYYVGSLSSRMSHSVVEFSEQSPVWSAC